MAANTSEELSSPATGAREMPRGPRERRLFPYLALIPAALFVTLAKTPRSTPRDK